MNNEQWDSARPTLSALTVLTVHSVRPNASTLSDTQEWRHYTESIVGPSRSSWRSWRKPPAQGHSALWLARQTGHGGASLGCRVLVPPLASADSMCATTVWLSAQLLVAAAFHRRTGRRGSGVPSRLHSHNIHLARRSEAGISLSLSLSPSPSLSLSLSLSPSLSLAHLKWCG